MFRLGYNTNGLPHHRIADALELLAELDYEAVALTPDAGQLDPLALDPNEVARVRLLSEELGLDLAVETGARFLLDPRRKHFPTLLEDDPADRARRVDFLVKSIDLAADLGAGVLSLWAGRAPSGHTGDEGGEGTEEEWDRLCAGLAVALERGHRQGVQIGFEPEPGMFIERPGGYVALVDRLGAAGDELGLCLDVGHLLCTKDLPVGEVIHGLGHRLVMVHLDDVAGGVHEHRMFGTGDLDLGETLTALLEVDYDGIAAVELPRDGHRAPEAAREAMARIREIIGA